MSELPPINPAGAAALQLPEFVPVFPLPGLVMFPRVPLPLHIFEHRYRAMTRDALAGSRLIAMATLVPGNEADYDGSPPIRPVGCVGRILEEERLPDGRFNFVLQGLARVRFGLELPADPYRRARVEVLPETPAPVERAVMLRQALTSLHGLFAAAGKYPEAAGVLLEGRTDLATVTDVLSFFLPVDGEFKRPLLEETDVAARALRLATILQGLAERLALSPARRRRPPEPSMN